MADERAWGKLNMHMMEFEEYRTHATLLVEQVKTVETELTQTKVELAEETAEKLKYIDLYEKKCVECEELRETLRKKLDLIKQLKEELCERDARIDELLLEVESLKAKISELEALRDHLQQQLLESREQNERDGLTIEENSR